MITPDRITNPVPIIKTKLHPPFTRPKLVLRPRLQEQIAQGLRCPLTVITAPAGFGKTTLVASSIIDCGMQTAWLSLDINDNQPESFLRYLVAALQVVDDSIGHAAAQFLERPQHTEPEAVLIHLINHLDSTNREIALVLDDYQYITSQAVHDQVSFLIEHCPKTFHLLITTRSDPSLPVTRLRARGQIVELRAADLRFTQAETAHFLSEVMDLQLDSESVTKLEQRTEGWIAGLQMAALSMRNRQDLTGFIKSFSGTNRYIVDYLLEEVLLSQPTEIQHFLLHTSILETLTAPLCDFLLATDEMSASHAENIALPAPSSNGQSAANLAYLEQANLFLVPLDDERIWYRYHHLFADLLRAQLHKTLTPEGLSRLHIRAAEWHAQNGSVLDAIHHASLASDAERVERFIQQNYIELVRRGEMSRIRLWIGNLSRELVYSRHWLCIYEAYSHAWFGRADEAIRLLEEAEKRYPIDASTPEVQSIKGHLTYVKSRVTAMGGDIQHAIDLCLAARKNIPADDLALQLDTLITLGYEYFLSGDFTSASHYLTEMIHRGTTIGAIINTVAASCVMARLYTIQGKLHQAYDTYQSAMRWIPVEEDQHLGVRALVKVGIAELLYQWNDLEAALSHLQEGLALMSMWDKADDLALAYVTRARIHLAQAKHQEATQAIEKATRLIQTRGVFSEARHAVENAQVRLWLAQGNRQAIDRWAASQEERLRANRSSAFENELLHISLARVLISRDRSHKAAALLSRLEENTRDSGRNGRLIEVLILKALALWGEGKHEQARHTLSESLELASPEGYTRIFLDAGQQMQPMIAHWVSEADSSPTRDYASHLLTCFASEPHASTELLETIPPTNQQALIEPLSQRELEVLALVALGKTNQEIARQLIVARGTIKAHAASIYRKLDVTNRTQAVARARQLGILS